MDFLNGKEITRKTLIKELKKILSRETIINAGGLLFKAHMQKDSFALGMVPCFWFGERKYHYDIHLPEEDEFTLFGNITSEGVTSIFFKMENITEEKKKEIRKRYCRFCDILLLAISRDWIPQLDPLTLQLLKDKNIYPENTETFEDLIS